MPEVDLTSIYPIDFLGIKTSDFNAPDFSTFKLSFGTN